MRKSSPQRAKGSLKFAGFLPVTKRGATWWALLGRESDGWGAFGGGPEEEDNGDPVRTAVREAMEESHGFLLTDQLTESASCSNPLLDSKLVKLYGVYIPWTLAAKMNKLFTEQQGQCRKPNNGCYEKTQAMWVPLDLLRYLQTAHHKKGRQPAEQPGDKIPTPLEPLDQLIYTCVDGYCSALPPANGLRAALKLSTENSDTKNTLSKLKKLYAADAWSGRICRKAVHKMTETCSQRDKETCWH